MKNGNYIPKVAVTEKSLLKRVAIFLEDGEFDRADEYCERVLDMNVENGEAYLYKLLAKFSLSKKEELLSLNEPFDNEPSYIKILRFGSPELKKELEDINASILKQKQEKERERALLQATELSQSDSISQLTQAYSLFKTIGDKENAESCRNKIEGIYDKCYNELYLEAKAKEQEINDRQYQNSSDFIEKNDYDLYIKENRDKKFFDYSLLVAAGVAVIGIVAIFFSVSNYLSLAGITFKTVLRCIFTKILPGMPLTAVSSFISFHLCKRLIKKQKSNLLEDIGTAAQRAKEISEKINNAESEAFVLQRELDERLEALRKLNDEYDLFVAEKEKEQSELVYDEA